MKQTFIMKNIPLNQIDEIIYDNYDDFDTAMTVVYQDKDYCEIMENSYIEITSLELRIHECFSASYNIETDDYEIDFSFYLFKNFKNETLYSEYGSSLGACIYNYLRCENKNISLSSIENLICNLVKG